MERDRIRAESGRARQDDLEATAPPDRNNGILEVSMDVPARARREIPIAYRTESRTESPLRSATDNRSR